MVHNKLSISTYHLAPPPLLRTQIEREKILHFFIRNEEQKKIDEKSFPNYTTPAYESTLCNHDEEKKYHHLETHVIKNLKSHRRN